MVQSKEDIYKRWESVMKSVDLSSDQKMTMCEYAESHYSQYLPICLVILEKIIKLGIDVKIVDGMSLKSFNRNNKINGILEKDFLSFKNLSFEHEFKFSFKSLMELPITFRTDEIDHLIIDNIVQSIKKEMEDKNAKTFLAYHIISERLDNSNFEIVVKSLYNII